MLHRSLLPPLTNLISFEAAARHESVSRAADELHLTQSAVSRQIHQLEEILGVPLFHRARKRMVLTDGGRLYAAEIRQHLSSVASASHRAMGFGGAHTFNLAVLPTFGTRWLIPRLGSYATGHPEVSVNVAARLAPFSFDDEPFDAAIHFGAPHWPGAVCEHLMDEHIVAACSPLYRQRMKLRRDTDLPGATRLQQSTRPLLWTDWFKAAAIDCPDALRGPVFEQFSMVAQAAVAGLGVALVPPLLVDEELASGRLQVLGDSQLTGNGAYYLVYSESKAKSPLVMSFRDWILKEARKIGKTS